MSLDFDLEPDFLDLFSQCRDESMASVERMYALYKAVEHVIATGVGGDFVECGVWRGGSAMMMALAARRFGDPGRRLWLYDTFEGMTPPDDCDVQAMSGVAAADILAGRAKTLDDPFWGVSPLSTVQANLERTGHAADLTRYVVGDVMESLPATAPVQIAVLRLDTDWFESTRHELEHLYPRLAPGGVLIIDDYGYWTGARRAVDEYFATLDRRPFLNRIDYTGRLAVKP